MKPNIGHNIEALLHHLFNTGETQLQNSPWKITDAATIRVPSLSCRLTGRREWGRSRTEASNVQGKE